MQPFTTKKHLRGMVKGYFFIALVILSVGCQEGRPEKELVPASTNDEIIDSLDVAKTDSVALPIATKGRYFIISRDSFKVVEKEYSKDELSLIAAINRVDENIILRPDSLVIPLDMSLPFNAYFPFPQTLPFLNEVNKMIIFSNPTQSFAAYKNGVLDLTGPTSMGKASKPTPRGLFFTNWKSERTISTVNSKWILKWNFNVANKMGVGFHEYQLPGYPASHSCMRLREEDARFLYDWADQWILKDANTIAVYGTPVIVYGRYPYGKRRPWRNLADDPSALAIAADSLQSIIEPHLAEIRQKQSARETLSGIAAGN